MCDRNNAENISRVLYPNDNVRSLTDAASDRIITLTYSFIARKGYKEIILSHMFDSNQILYEY